MPKTVATTIYRFDELPTQAAKDRAIAHWVAGQMLDYDSTVFEHHTGQTLEALGFQIEFEPVVWSGITWNGYKFEYDHNFEDFAVKRLRWTGVYTYRADWRDALRVSPYGNGEYAASLVHIGERLEKLQQSIKIPLVAAMTEEEGTLLVDEQNITYGVTYGLELRHYTRFPVIAPALEEMRRCYMLATEWAYDQLKSMWDGTQDPASVATLLMEYGDWFYANGEKAYDQDEVNDDDDASE